MLIFRIKKITIWFFNKLKKNILNNNERLPTSIPKLISIRRIKYTTLDICYTRKGKKNINDFGLTCWWRVLSCNRSFRLIEAKKTKIKITSCGSYTKLITTVVYITIIAINLIFELNEHAVIELQLGQTKSCKKNILYRWSNGKTRR